MVKRPRRVEHATFRRRRFRFRMVAHLGVNPEDGHDYAGDTDLEGRLIRLRQGMSPRETFRAAIHEGLHAGLWDLDEEAVDELAGDLTRFLVRLGLAPED